MKSSALKGRRIVLAVCVVVLSVSIAVDVLAVLMVGDGISISDVVRLVLTLVLCYFLYRGASVARWIAVVLFVAGGLLSFVSLFALIPHWSAWLLGVMGLVYLSGAAAFIFHRAVKVHFKKAAADAA